MTQKGDVAAVGEVDLDGSSRYRKSYDVQRSPFEAIIERTLALGGRVLSIHSCQAVNDVLAVLDRHAGFGTAVMHWFTGSVKELRAAEERGCCFSMGPAAFASSSGREPVRIFVGQPLDHLGPPQPCSVCRCARWPGLRACPRLADSPDAGSSRRPSCARSPPFWNDRNRS